MKTTLYALLLAAAALAVTASAEAKDVRLPAQRASICVGKSGSLMQTKTQLEELVVNGLTSPNSTFNVRTRNATLTCDFDTTDSIVAFCHSPGRQVVDVRVKTAYADPNRYLVQIALECKVCPGRGGGAGGGGGMQPIPEPMPRPGRDREELPR